MSIKTEDLVNWSAISELLTGKKDIIRVNRVSKKHKEQVNKLLTLLDYWKNTCGR